MSREQIQDLDPEVRTIVTTSTDIVQSSRVNSDASVNRWQRNAAGKLEWGPGGSAAVDTNLYRSAANVLATDDALVVALGILPSAGAVFTAARKRWQADGGEAPTLTTGADTAPTAGTIYFVPLFLPTNYTITGLGFLIGSVGGTDGVIVALYDSGGLLLANSLLTGSPAGTTCGTTATFQEIALTATYAAKGPALYFAAVQISGNTCRLRLSVANGARGSSQAGSQATLATLTPLPTTTAAAPIMYAY